MQMDLLGLMKPLSGNFAAISGQWKGLGSVLWRMDWKPHLSVKSVQHRPGREILTVKRKQD
ncbi:MAG: hypothetical protein QMD22_00415 [archaeon]|nr:hypothetical protein [archaeon]